MWHCKMIKVLVFINAWILVSGSIIEFNGTLQDTAPSLYHLNDWYRCQHEGDRYCLIEYIINATDSVWLKGLLEDYSTQSLKHFNRTLVHRGVCFSGDNVQEDTYKQLHEDGITADVYKIHKCQAIDSKPQSDAGRALAVVCVTLLALAVIGTGVHIFGDRCSSLEGNRFLLAFSMKKNWEILTYDRSKPMTDKRMKDLTCIEGIRFLGIQCVIFSHVIFMFLYSYIDNPQYIENMYDQFVWQAVLNTPIWLQAFFCMSGFLTSYTMIICNERSQLTVIQYLLAMVNRYMRLTPVALFALWFTMSWLPMLGSGPQWWWLVARESDDCTDRWYYHLLYIHNHLPLGKLCMGHTWYLAVDMQLHILGLVLLFFFLRNRVLVKPVLLGLLGLSAVVTGAVVYFYELTPIITAQSPEALRTYFADSKVMSILYLPSWMNLGGYLCGMAVAFILHECQTKDVELNQIKWFNVVFHLALPFGGLVVMMGTFFLHDSPPSVLSAAIYSALDRTLVSVCIAVFLLGCFTRCKSHFRDMFEWRGFHTLGRLSYCAFLVHFIVLRLTLASNTQLGHASLYSMISLLITASVLTYIVCIPLCLLIELPLIQLWKALIEKERVSERSLEEVEPQNSSKPFDLVAHVNKGLEA